MKKGAKVELHGLVGKPELNGCVGVIIKDHNPETGRCCIKLDDGTNRHIGAKLENILILTPEVMLERALAKLKKAGGSEDPEDNDNEEDKDPLEYLDELLAVGEARYNLGEYDKAGGIYYDAYYISMGKENCINHPESFPVAHKMLEAWSKSDDKYTLKRAHGMAQQTLMMPGCPRYIRDDMEKVEEAMRRQGVEVEDLMAGLGMGLGGMGMGMGF
jgi:hypothetical protein